MTDLTGQTLHGYQIRDKIGEGGYGAVYKAYQTAVDREVAIKVILPEHASKSEFAQRFETEARLVAKLEHPHIVPLHDYWRDENGAFLVMRWLPTSLRATLRKQGALSLAQTARLLDQLADALAVAHQAGVIYRDLKPDNILLDERGNAYLTDFGIAKRLDSSANITGTDAIIGTPAYLAPEQIKNEALTPQTDIYALGVMLYELLAGQHPFVDTPSIMLVVKHLQEPLPLLHDKRPDVPAAVDEIIQKATAKTPADRYPDASAVASAFRDAANLTPGAPGVDMQSVGTRHAVSLQPESPKVALTPEQRNRHNMLQNVRKFWIEGVLENSLHGAALIELGMKQASGTIDHAWDTLLRMPGVPDETLPPSTQILDVFDKLNGKLLILGDPGGGKTTSLLELARDLLYRADADEQHPIPVIFNLSSWSENRKPLVEWLVDELSSKYQVPKKVAQAWVESEALLLLLDGLDEVTRDQREACVQAINAYRAEHGFVDVVVCSRIADYEALTNRLKLNGAIVIQPLDTAQVDRYLASLGAEMGNVRRMLTSDATLRELARSPLMLSILALAYRGVSEADLPKLATPEAQRQHIFEVYVRRMFERRIGEKPYTQEQTVHYLSWLARKMQEHAQGIFQIEKMQPTWLNAVQWEHYYASLLRFYSVITATVYAVGSFVFAPAANLSPWMLGSLSALTSLVLNWAYISDRYRQFRWLLLSCVPLGIAWGLTFMTVYGAVWGAVAGVTIVGLLAMGGYFIGQVFIRRGITRSHIVMIEQLHFSWKVVNPWAGVLGFMTVVISAPIAVLFAQGSIHTETTPLRVVLGTLGGALVYSGYLLRESGLTHGEVELHTRPNQGLWNTLNTAIRATVVTVLSIVLACLLAFGLSISLQVGLGIGATFAGSAGLGTWGSFGGYPVAQHYVLRRVLYRDGAIPQNYARFLDYAASLIFLRKVGGGYIFVHRYLLEYFVGLENK